MSHEIETHGTHAAAVFARKDAWHRLGTTVRDRAFSAEEAMTLGHLGGWEVRKLPLTTAEVSEGGVTPIEVPGFATVRTTPFTGQPEALGVVGGGYTPLQNEDHAEFLNLLADESGAIFDTAGSLRGGRQVFITMQLPNSLTVGGTDRVDLNIAALNSHDGTSAFRILVTPVRVVCANTQSAALSNHESSFSIRHTHQRQGRRPGPPPRPRPPTPAPPPTPRSRRSTGPGASTTTPTRPPTSGPSSAAAAARGARGSRWQPRSHQRTPAASPAAQRSAGSTAPTSWVRCRA
ncbi:DUF932 domain-containing protein [Nocardioides sp.]